MESIQGTVLSVSGQLATVSVDTAAVCPRCAAGKGCGAGLFGASSASRSIDIELPPADDIRPGDRVTLSILPKRLLHASMLVYGLPLAGVLILLLLGFLFMRPLTDAVAVSLAMAGLLGGFLLGRSLLGRESCLRQFVPAVTGRSNDAS
jgi:sigma-E factor negative regulatory protein RseC